MSAVDELNSVDAAILEALAAHPEGMTSLELADYTGIERVSVSPRLRPLANRGVIVEAGKRIASDVPVSIVWALPKAGEA